MLPRSSRAPSRRCGRKRPAKVRVQLQPSADAPEGCEERAELRGWELSTSRHPQPGAAGGVRSTAGPPGLLRRGSCAIQWRRPGPGAG